MWPVIRGLRVADRLDRVSLLLEPLSRREVQGGDRLGRDPPQLEPQEVGEQVVVSKPRSRDVQRGHERVRVVELLQPAFGARSPGQVVRQRSAHPIENRGPQQQLTHLGRLVLDHLRDQVLRDGALGSGELSDEALGVGVMRHRDRRETQARRPALRALVKQVEALVGECDIQGAE